MHKMVRNGFAAGAGRVKKSAAREKPLCIAEAVESIVRCKWSLQVLGQIRRGVTRPGALIRACAGLSTKVLNERLAKMVRFGILERRAFPEVPPRVEYRLTDLGGHFVKILDAIEDLQSRVDGAGTSVAATAAQHLTPLRKPAGHRTTRKSAS